MGSLLRSSSGNPNGRVNYLVDGVTTADVLTGRQKLGMVGFLARNGSAVVRAGEEGDRTEAGNLHALVSKVARAINRVRKEAERQGFTAGNITVVLNLGSGAQPNGAGVTVLLASGPAGATSGDGGAGDAGGGPVPSRSMASRDKAKEEGKRGDGGCGQCPTSTRKPDAATRELLRRNADAVRRHQEVLDGKVGPHGQPLEALRIEFHKRDGRTTWRDGVVESRNSGPPTWPFQDATNKELWVFHYHPRQTGPRAQGLENCVSPQDLGTEALLDAVAEKRGISVRWFIVTESKVIDYTDYCPCFVDVGE